MQAHGLSAVGADTKMAPVLFWHILAALNLFHNELIARPLLRMKEISSGQ
jgi:hypothetical protein